MEVKPSLLLTMYRQRVISDTANSEDYKIQQ